MLRVHCLGRLMVEGSVRVWGYFEFGFSLYTLPELLRLGTGEAVACGAGSSPCLFPRPLHSRSTRRLLLLGSIQSSPPHLSCFACSCVVGCKRMLYGCVVSTPDGFISFDTVECLARVLPHSVFPIKEGVPSSMIYTLPPPLFVCSNAARA